jgi:hypothetical protein
MRSDPVSITGYSAKRMTVEVGSTPADFRSRYELAVPPLPVDEVKALVERQAPLQEMVDLISAQCRWGSSSTSRMTGLAQSCGSLATRHPTWHI